MRSPRPRGRRPGAARLLWLPALLALAGCTGPGRDVFAPVCPTIAALPGAGDLALYRPGGGRDLTDVELEGTILSASGACRDGEKSGTVEADLTMQMRFQRGPAAPTRQANLPYFVGLARGDAILNKAIRTIRVTFPANVDVATVTTRPLQVIIPVGADRSAAAYQIWVGFQQTAAPAPGPASPANGRGGPSPLRPGG